MKHLRTTFKKLWRDESAQGATEYILLLVVIVAVVVIFKDKIMGVIQGKVNELGDKVQGFNP